MPKTVEHVTKVVRNTSPDLTRDEVGFQEAYFRVLTMDIVWCILLERTCLACRLNNRVRVARGLPKIGIRGRCHPYQDFGCKMGYVLAHVFKEIDFDFL